jgi:hypothetical protein
MLVLFLLRNAIVIFGEGNRLRRTEAIFCCETQQHNTAKPIGFAEQRTTNNPFDCCRN